MATAEGGMIEDVARSSSHIPTSMGQPKDIQGTPSLPYPPHPELTLHMLPGTPSMATCLLRAMHRHSRPNTKVSCNKLDNLGHQGMTSLLALRIRRLMQERHPTMPTCSMPINSGWLVRLDSPSLGMAVRETATAPPGTGQAGVHRAPQGDQSMAPLCREPTMLPWDTAMTMAGTGVPQRMLHPGGVLETVVERGVPGEPSATRSCPLLLIPTVN